jgi:hypothetical protein
MRKSQRVGRGLHRLAVLLVTLLSSNRIAAAAFVVLILTAPGALTASDNYRVTCENIRGTRLLYQDNELGPAESNRRLTRSNDAISGGKVEIVFSVNGKNAVFTEYANENTDNALSVMKLFNAGQTNDMITFWGFDVDGKAELITLYPKLGKAIWTTHNDRISFVDRLALSKSLMMDCMFKKLGD